MKKVERAIRLYRKVDVNESMEERHEKVMEGLSKLEEPLGLKDSEIPEIPDFGTELVCFYDAKNIMSIMLIGLEKGNQFEIIADNGNKEEEIQLLASLKDLIEVKKFK